MLSKTVSSLSLRGRLLACVCLFALVSCGESGEFKSNGEQANAAEDAHNANIALKDIVAGMPSDVSITEGLVHHIQVSAEDQAVLDQLGITIEEVSIDAATGELVALKNAPLFPIQSSTTDNPDGTSSKEDDEDASHIHVYKGQSGGNDAFIRLKPEADASGEATLRIVFSYDGEVVEKLISVSVLATNKAPVISTVVSKASFDLADPDTHPLLVGHAVDYHPI
ncbi:MAG: hypothetical protein KAG18_02325, partial [Sinobacterium sp.]|nr:hypothetical protein [Sinobacterium sp.]